LVSSLRVLLYSSYLSLVSFTEAPIIHLSINMTRSGSSTSSYDWMAVIGFAVGHLLFFYALLTHSLTRETFVLTCILYSLTGFSLSAGYHRLWSHGTYAAALPLRLFMLIFGAGAFVGPALTWAHHHRAHHRFIDTSKDPSNIKKGLHHAHIGWRLLNIQPNPQVGINDLEKDWWLRWQKKTYLLLALLVGLALPSYIASLWGDMMGGLLFAGFGKIVLIQHAYFSMQSYCHTMGFQPYSNQHSGRNLFCVSMLTFGEGYMNYHHEFPNDFRMAPKFWDADATKWFLWILSFAGLVSNLQQTKDADIKKAKIDMKQRKLDAIKAKLDFGPETSSLPIENWASVQKRSDAGAKLVVIDGLVHDVSSFVKEHPGGVKILESKMGKDATLAFNGAIYRHTKAARNLAALLRVSRLPKEEIDLRVNSDTASDMIPTVVS